MTFPDSILLMVDHIFGSDDIIACENESYLKHDLAANPLIYVLSPEKKGVMIKLLYILG